MKKEEFEDQELIDRIKEGTKDVTLPESLQPEKMEALLQEKRQKKWKPSYTFAAAAACFCIVIGALAITAVKSDNANNQAAENLAESVNEGSEIAAAADYDEIFEYIQAQNDRAASQTGGHSKTLEMESASDTAGATARSAGQSAASSYSDSNVRAEGVGEGDIAKTDGKNLYILNNNQIQIVNTEGQEMKEIGNLSLGDDNHISELYLADQKLIVVYTENHYAEDSSYAGGELSKSYTKATTYDISDPANAKELGTLSQSGNYYSMRVVDGYAYLFSRFYAEMGCARTDVASYIPEVQGEPIAGRHILLPQHQYGNSYLVVSSFALNKPGEKISSKAIFGDDGIFYVSSENIYTCESYYYDTDNNMTQTGIRKVSYKDGKLEAVGQTKVEGTLNDSFSIDEYEENLRLVTTVSPAGGSQAVPFPWFRTLIQDRTDVTRESETNSLYVLDKNLKELGKIEGLAKDEEVYSARFMGDIGYFVTFRQVDPLFSVDLSDPENPNIVGQLKIPGFSDYLHPYGEGKLLGVGMDVDASGTTTNGVKISMYDISNPADVSETQKYVLDGTYSTDVSYDYKAVLIDVEKNIIGFSAYGDSQHYYIFSYDEGAGFTCRLDRTLGGHYGSVRGVYIESTLYIVAGNTIESYDMESFDKIDDIVL